MPLFITMHVIVELAGVSECTISYSWNWWGYRLECFHVTSQSRENRTGGHFGVQLNGDLVCCMMRMQNAVQTWQLMDLPHKYVQYRYPVHVICETWAHWLHSSRLFHTSFYLLVHQDGPRVQKYHGVMQTYIIFNHVMKTLYIRIRYVTTFRVTFLSVTHHVRTPYFVRIDPRFRASH